MPQRRFRKLGLFYFLALGCIALTISLSQLFIQTYIESQKFDSRTINIAGRQRMLSQKLSKTALLIHEKKGIDDDFTAEFEADLSLWVKSHKGLKSGSKELELNSDLSPEISRLFDAIEPHFQQVRRSSESILASRKSGNDDFERHLKSLLESEGAFLKGMNDIVFQFDKEASLKVAELQRLEYLLYFVSLLIILLELMFIFRPLARRIQLTMNELEESEKSSKELAGELSRLYEELGKSYQDLESVNVTPQSQVILTRLSIIGDFLYFSEELKSILGLGVKHPKNLKELMLGAGYREDFVTDLLSHLSDGRTWSGEVKLTTQEGDFCWIESYLVPVEGGREIKFIGRDVTELKEAKMVSREINKERIDKIVKEQNFRSSLILQGQEEERKRLSQELHDGVGQMLSAMKLSLESISPSDAKHMKARLNDAKDLMKSIIREVRRVSFNLTPSSLDDFGLVPAIKKFCEEINTYSKPEVSFVNETNFINRLDTHIETSLYRIVQEAVNNALKYARASRINVKFSHSIEELRIEINDDGDGFDLNNMEESKAGHGLFNMKERAAYIGSELQVKSAPEAGTQIIINLSLREHD